MEDHYIMTDGDGCYLNHIIKPVKKKMKDLLDDLGQQSEHVDDEADA